ncbi:MAG: hypothetical protein DRI69_07600 [Bacteroidetes bacterium]|nr:MAG: hypothetical protein DRI69_07600 [Bacteroidota bacterium]
MAPDSTEKSRIRKRDQRLILRTGTCVICGATDVDTSRHHLWYPKAFNPNAVIEVCDECDDKIHDREDAEQLGRTINAIHNLTIENGDVWLAGTRIGVASFDEDDNISIDMRKR